jgi:hypothetical protein
MQVPQPDSQSQGNPVEDLLGGLRHPEFCHPCIRQLHQENRNHLWDSEAVIWFYGFMKEQKAT